MCHEPNKTGAEPGISKRHDLFSGDACKTQETSIKTGVVTHGHIETGKREDDDDAAAF
jgi:hypothetical protein